jgi:hypothetical protein
LHGLSEAVDGCNDIADLGVVHSDPNFFDVAFVVAGAVEPLRRMLFPPKGIAVSVEL